ncbi:hypothetical protein IFM89_019595, partial [Coptis chinensis]
HFEKEDMLAVSCSGDLHNLDLPQEKKISKPKFSEVGSPNLLSSSDRPNPARHRHSLDGFRNGDVLDQEARQLQSVLQIGRWRSLRRTALPKTTAKKGADYPVTPIVLGFFVFFVIGSCELFPLFNFNITVNLSFIVEFFRADLEHRPRTEFIKESIDFSLGLLISTNTLELKLCAFEEARKRLQDPYFLLHSRLKEKDQRIDHARSKASQSALALKKFVEESQKLATECTNLLNQCTRWEKECLLYDRDREALMEFANEADERAKEAEVCVLDIEDELKNALEELEEYKKNARSTWYIYYLYILPNVSETQLIEELHLMREKITMLEQSRDGRIKLLGKDITQALLQSNDAVPSKFIQFLENQGILFNVTVQNNIEASPIC